MLSLLLVGIAAAPATASGPPQDAAWDYQLGGARAVPAAVGVVVRDREARPLPGAWNVCYVNAFQTQPGERRLWRERHWRLVLKDRGRPVVDEGWGEWLLDLRRPARRAALTRVVGRWIDRCAEDGFDAVELDNLDSFTRSHGLLRPRHAKAYARSLVERAHAAGLEVAQKNWAELDGASLGFDFAIAESCGRWRECGAYVRSYGARVLVVEYSRADFRRTCRQWGARVPVLLRDRALARDGLRRFC